MKKEDLKIGQIVEVVGGKDIPGWKSYMDKYLGEIGNITVVYGDGAEIEGFEGWWFHCSSLEKVTELEHLKEGDFIKRDEDNYFQRVLAVLGGTGETTVYQLSGSTKHIDDDGLKCAEGVTYTFFELKKRGYHLCNPEVKTIREVTMEEVCENFGYEVKIKK